MKCVEEIYEWGHNLGYLDPGSCQNYWTEIREWWTEPKWAAIDHEEVEKITWPPEEQHTIWSIDLLHRGPPECFVRSITTIGDMDLDMRRNWLKSSDFPGQENGKTSNQWLKNKHHSFHIKCVNITVKPCSIELNDFLLNGSQSSCCDGVYCSLFVWGRSTPAAQD